MSALIAEFLHRSPLMEKTLMQRLDDERRFAPRGSRRTIALGCALAFSLAACNKTADVPATVAKSGDAVASKATKISACALMPKEEVNSITGESYTTVESHDDEQSDESSCHYSTASAFTNLSLRIQWISLGDRSNPAHHAALQRTGILGTQLAEKLTGGMAGGSLPGMRSGKVEGVGDEAEVAAQILTARKGDYTVHVQMMAADMIAAIKDSAAANAVLEKEKAVARKVLGKL